MLIVHETFMKLRSKTPLLCLVASYRRPKPKGIAPIAFALAAQMLILQMFLLTVPANAAVHSQDQKQSPKREPIGSLSATGEVYVNDKPAPVESAAPVKPAAPAVETAAPAAMRPGVGEIWLAERGSAQQSSCDCQRPSDPGPGSRFA